MPRGRVLQVFHGHAAYGEGRYALLRVRADDDLHIGDYADMVVLREPGVPLEYIAEFIAAGEPKCEHVPREFHGCIGGDQFVRCQVCGAILQDRRKGERRQGKRRAKSVDRRCPDGGYLYARSHHDRRTGKDRRKL
jgi:hypothetical protein